MRILIFATLLASSVLGQQAYDCAPGCINCTKMYGCAACYNSALLPKPTLSGILSQQGPQWDCFPKQPKDTSNCAVWGIYQFGAKSGCFMCNQGYALNQNTYTCVLNTIKDCQDAFKIGGSDTTMCQTCNNGYPAES